MKLDDSAIEEIRHAAPFVSEQAVKLMSGKLQASQTAQGLQIAATAQFYLQDWALDLRTLARLLGVKYIYQVDQNLGGVSAALRLKRDLWLCYHTAVRRWRVVPTVELTGETWHAKVRTAAR